MALGDQWLWALALRPSDVISDLLLAIVRHFAGWFREPVRTASQMFHDALSAIV